MKTRFAAIAVGLVAMLSLVAGPAFAAVPVGTLDQQQSTHSWNGLAFGPQVAQTFTASAPGTLTTVGVYIELYDPNAADHHVTGRLYNTTGGLPTGSPLVTMTINTIVSTPTWYLFTFPTPPSSVANTQYAFVLQGASAMFWYGNCANDYGPGKALIDDGGWIDFATYTTNHPNVGEDGCVQDFAFETYVTAPGSRTLPPTSMAPEKPSSDGGNPISVLVAVLAGAASLVVLRRRLSVRTTR